MSKNSLSNTDSLGLDPNTQEQKRHFGFGAESKSVKSVTMVYKNHLDIGFTESVSKVTHDAIYWMLGESIALDHKLKTMGRNFTWTTPSWVIWEALEICKGDTLKRIERGIAEGALAWHALPFTAHTELQDELTIRSSLSLSQKLDRRFGKVTRAAKLTDVPGHSLGLIPALVEAGVEYLHIGVNHMSALCKLPAAFRWREPNSGKEVVVNYGGGYGGCHRLPQDDRVLLWRMVGDNCEVPSQEDVLADIRRAQEEMPEADVCIGKMEHYLSDDFQARSRNLPVIESELGDSWIHGTGSDPWKSQRFRALQRCRRDWVNTQRISSESLAYIDFGKNLSLITEHTWGVNFNAHNHHDNKNWNRADFERIRHRGHIRVIEGSWQEQRDYLEFAALALPDDLRKEAQKAMNDCTPESWSSDLASKGWQNIDLNHKIEVPTGQVKFDVMHGHLVHYQRDSEQRCEGAMGQYRYQSFDHNDALRYCESYCQGVPRLEEFCKLGLEGTDAISAWWEPNVVAAYRREISEATEVLVILKMSGVPCEKLGAPQRIEMLTRFLKNKDRVEFELQVFDAAASRLPEASWWTFQPKVTSTEGWRLHKCGQWIDPQTVISRGGRELHGVQSGAKNGKVCFETLDAHLIAPGQPQLYRFNEGEVDMAGGLHLNLHNNCWGTNFVMWSEDDLKFRASISWD